MKTMKPMKPKFRIWHNISLASYFSLLFTIIIWYFVVSPPQIILSAIFSGLYVLILLTPIVMLLKKDPRVYAWSNFIMLIYFSHAIIETWANDERRLFAIAELVFSSLYFVSATICARYAKQEN